MQNQKLHDILETIKQEGIEFATLLLAKLAGHVADTTVTTLGDQPQCKPGQTWSATLKACIDDPA